MAISEHSISVGPHTTFFLQAGDESATPIIFVHGWPELSLSWRHQLPAVAQAGFRAIAPDMRGYGRSTVYNEHGAYAQEHVVQDMLDLIDSLGIQRAIWVGHDWGSPTVWNMAAHHPERCIAVASLCVPFATLEYGWDGFLTHVDRSIYPEQELPYGQWEYMRFYEEAFDKATHTFDSDPLAVIQLLFRKGTSEGAGLPSATAFVRQQGGWFGGGEIPQFPRDEAVITEEELQTYARYLKQNTFFGPDSYYMNHTANAAFSANARRTLDLPVLFLHARYDYTCETMTSTLAEPMRSQCTNLVEHVVDSGHWMAQEQPAAVNEHLLHWLETSVGS